MILIGYDGLGNLRLLLTFAGALRLKNRTRVSLDKNPNKLYIIRKLNKCTLRKKYNFRDVFFQDVSGAGKA